MMGGGGAGWAGIAQSGFDTAMQGALDAAKMKASYKYAKKLAVHRYPWAVESLKRAGLNPVLAVGGAMGGQGALTGSSSKAGRTDVVGAIRSSAQTDLARAQADAARATARHQNALAGLANVNRQGAEADLERRQTKGGLWSQANRVVQYLVNEFEKDRSNAKTPAEMRAVEKMIQEWFTEDQDDKRPVQVGPRLGPPGSHNKGYKERKR